MPLPPPARWQLHALRRLTAALLVAAVAGCTAPGGKPPGAAATTPAANPSPSPSPSGPPYRVINFDICKATDLKVLGDLAHRTDAVEPDLDNADGDVDGDGDPDVAGSVKCVFRLLSAKGGDVLLVVHATAHAP
ncbi:MAG: hypothetical protein ACRDJ9_33985, partial [Dehalococcoidia bacterium]